MPESQRTNKDPQPVKIATRRGDEGETDLLFGQRVGKDHPQIEVVGLIDEINAALGLARAFSSLKGHRRILKEVQADLIVLMGELSVPVGKDQAYAESKLPKFTEASLGSLDALVAHLESLPLVAPGWVLPGQTEGGAFLDQARVLTRRAERILVSLPEKCGRTVRPLLFHYLNRLSDLLWLMARQTEK